MRIGIDASTISPSKAGVGYYTFSMTKALAKIDPENKYILFTNNKENLECLGKLPGNFYTKEISSNKINFKWVLDVSNSNKEYDLFFSPAIFTFGILFPKTIQTIHDLAPIKFPEFFSKSGSLKYKLQLNIAVKRAKLFVTHTNTVRNELIEQYPSIKNKIFSISFGLNHWVYTKPTQEDLNLVKRKYNLPQKYILSVSTIEPRKNHLNLIKGFSQFRKKHPDYKLVIVGKKGWFYEEIFSTVEELQLHDNIMFLGYVPEEELPSIYDLSKGVIMLSFYEGIGLSAAEGVARGLPVVASDITVFREILSESAKFVDPKDIDRITESLEYFTKTPRRDDTGEYLNKYSWEKAAQNLRDLFVKVV